jgi:hypothetical protein
MKMIQEPRRRWTLLTLVSSASFSSEAVAQPAAEPAYVARNSVGLAAGPVHYRLIDEGHTPRRLLLRGTNARFGLDFDRVAETYWLAASAAASADYVESPRQDWRSELVSLGLSIAYARQLAEYTLAGGRQRSFLGASFDSDTYYLGDEQIPGNFDALFVHGVNLDLRQRLDLGWQQAVSASLRVPALVFVDRRARGRYGDTPPDADFSVSDLFYGGKASVFPLTRFVTLQLDYRKLLSTAVAARLSYRFRYCSVPSGVPYDLYSNELSIGLTWSF